MNVQEQWRLIVRNGVGCRDAFIMVLTLAGFVALAKRDAPTLFIRRYSTAVSEASAFLKFVGVAGIRWHRK